MSNYHIPVLAEKCALLLAPHPGGVYVDCTLGGGGHALALFEHCEDITLIGFDQDEEAIISASMQLQKFSAHLETIRANFSRMRTELALRMIKSVDGVIFDLGVSSHQFDTDDRGFSYDNDALLDMRMDKSSPYTAADAVNDLSMEELAKIFREYGEELNAGRIARAIINSRTSKPILTTGQLSRVVEKVSGVGTRDSQKSKARIFQSLRIHVNRELDVLEPALQDAINILKPGGRIVVLSYHSLEDRVVKNLFRSASEGDNQYPAQDQNVNIKKKQLVLLTRKPLVADEAETTENSRSRSVKLRAAEKIREEK
jgi:16S rRNA (cytosine1402-N4)-methyltransferase